MGAFIVILFFIGLMSFVCALIWKEKTGFNWMLWKWLFNNKAPVNTSTVTNEDLLVNVGDGTISLKVRVNITKLSKGEREFIGDIIDRIQEYQSKTGKNR